MTFISENYYQESKKMYKYGVMLEGLKIPIEEHITHNTEVGTYFNMKVQ